MNQSFDLALRQLASVMLKKYVEDHWGNDESVDNTQKTVVATNQAKEMIRKILPNGLYDPNSKIRASVAYTISTIAAIDWPHTWTDLFDIIVKCLGGNEDSIHGAMNVLVEFSYDLESQVAVVGPVILNEIYRIFEAEQVSLLNQSFYFWIDLITIFTCLDVQCEYTNLCRDHIQISAESHQSKHAEQRGKSQTIEPSVADFYQ